MIKVTQVKKSYGHLQVLKGVDLMIEPGSIVSIMGKSGAGKSTLLQIIGTLDQADSGDIIINDVPIKSLNARQLSAFRNKSIGFVFQFHHLLPEFNALENTMMPALIGGASKKDAATKAQELLEYLHLSDRMHHKPSELSGGEQQRIAIARALINQPKVVLADEPTGNLDTKSSAEFHQLITKLRQDFKQTFLIVTHNPELARLSDRTLVMEDGKIVNSES